MSSFTRRIQRQVVSSGRDGELYRNPPRKVFYMGRGSQLGVKNPKDKALLARMKREANRRKVEESQP